MHNGTEATLEAVVELYDLGGRDKRTSLSSEIVPLNLTAREKADVVAFMHALTSNDEPIALPVLPR